MPNKDYWGLIGQANTTDEFKRFCGADGVAESLLSRQVVGGYWIVAARVYQSTLRPPITSNLFTHSASFTPMRVG